MQKALASRGLCPQTPYRSLTTRPHWGTSDPPASLATLTINESLCFSLRLCFSNDICSVPNSQRTRNHKHGYIRGWITLTKILVQICLYCLKCTKFGQLILRKIIKIVATGCKILWLKCTKFDLG